MPARFVFRSRGQPDIWSAPAIQPSRHAVSSAGDHFGLLHRARAATTAISFRSRDVNLRARASALFMPPRLPIFRIHETPLGVWFAMLHRYLLSLLIDSDASAA